MSDTFPVAAIPAAPAPEQAPADPSAAVEPAAVVDPPADFQPGAVVFYEAVQYGNPEPVTHAGLVIHAAGGRVRVKDLGAAVESADFPASTVRAEA